MPRPHQQTEPRLETAADVLQRAIDRRVATARVVHVLGISGRIACAAAGTWCALLALAGLVAAAQGPVIDIRILNAIAAATAVATAWPVVRAAFPVWPTRLRIAIATEQAQPELGERISRAIGFLGEQQCGGATPAGADHGGSPALKALAIAQAAEVADSIARPPIAGGARHLLLAAAGTAALLGLALVAVRMGRIQSLAEQAATAAGAGPASAAGERQPRSVATATLALWRQIEAARAGPALNAAAPLRKPLLQTVATLADSSRVARAAFPGRSGSGLLAFMAHELTRLEEQFGEIPVAGSRLEEAPVDAGLIAAVRHSLGTLSAVSRAAAGIAAAAEFQGRLAAVLTSWFNAAPGAALIDLPPRRRGLLMQTALLQQGCLEGVTADRATLLSSAAATDTATDAATAGIDEAVGLLAAIDESAQVESCAAIRDHRLAAAVREATSNAVLLERAALLLGMAAPTAANGSQFAGDPSSALIRQSADEFSGVLDQLNRLADATLPDAVAASGTGPSDQAAPRGSTAADDGAGGVPSATTASPRSGTDATATTGIDLVFGTAGVDRPWALLPEQSQPLRPQSGDAAAFPSHQQAIDTYYRLLFEHESARRRKEEVSQP